MILCGKAPGADGIPNEVLKALSSEISEGLAHAISRLFAIGSLPGRYKESVTITLRKEGKKDHSLPGSYRPIALENTLAKVIEKVLAVVSRPRFSYDTHTRRIRGIRETVSETQAEAFCIYIYEAGPPGFLDR